MLLLLFLIFYFKFSHSQSPRILSGVWNLDGTSYIFGGKGPKIDACSTNECILGDFWQFQFSTSQWTLLKNESNLVNSTNTNIYPNSRYASNTWYDQTENILIMHGGMIEDKVFEDKTTQDIWKYSISNSEWIFINESIPNYGGVAFTVQGHHYLFGGCDNTAVFNCSSDLLELIVSPTDINFKTISNNTELPIRFGWIHWLVEDTLFLFGGESEGKRSGFDFFKLQYDDQMESFSPIVKLNGKIEVDGLTPSEFGLSPPSFSVPFVSKNKLYFYGGVVEGSVQSCFYVSPLVSDLTEDFIFSIAKIDNMIVEESAYGNVLVGPKGEVYLFNGKNNQSVYTELTQMLFSPDSPTNPFNWTFLIFVVVICSVTILVLVFVGIIVGVFVIILFTKNMKKKPQTDLELPEKTVEAGADDQIMFILKDLEMEEYYKNFKKYDVDFGDLAVFNEQELENLIELKIPRKRFLAYLDKNPTFFKESQKVKLREKLKNDNYILDESTIEKGKELSKGSFGIVHEGKLKIGLVSLSVAIKTISLDESNKDDVKHEVALMSNLEHENVLSCYGVAFRKEENVADIVTEFCPKGDLFDYKKTICTPEEKVKIILEIAKGMKYLHGKNVIHRDLKTQNVLISKDGCCKICDFGSSRRTQSINYTFCGTLEYLAPEQYDLDLAGEGINPKLIDIYSFAISIWEVWSGKTPYDDDKLDEESNNNQMEKLKLIQTREARPPMEKVEDMPEELKLLMKKCWETDPLNRYPDFGKIVSIIEKIYGDFKK